MGKKPIKNPKAIRTTAKGGKLNSGGHWGAGPGRPPGKTPKGVIQEKYGSGDQSGLEKLLEVQYAKAMEGDQAAAKIILEYGWGKPIQPITGEEGGAVQVDVRFPDI
jgi:hypothetical protein